MNIEQIIDEIQASLTKLRGRLRDKGKAGEIGHKELDEHLRRQVDPSPDLPLNARVAKALGHACWTDRDGKWRSHMGRFIPNGVEYPFVPDYPTDLEAAMGALEEYCGKKKNYSICYYPDFPKTLRISIWDLGSGGLSEIDVNCPLSQAICEAIVAHREQP